MIANGARKPSGDGPEFTSPWDGVAEIAERLSLSGPTGAGHMGRAAAALAEGTRSPLISNLLGCGGRFGVMPFGRLW